jgi:predicted DNA-binding antitoxin AbrB/MazE fold protein
MKIKAIYEHEVLKPLEKLDLKDGEEVELMLTKKISEKTFGLFKLDHDAIEEIIEDTEYGSW